MLHFTLFSIYLHNFHLFSCEVYWNESRCRPGRGAAGGPQVAPVQRCRRCAAPGERRGRSVFGASPGLAHGLCCRRSAARSGRIHSAASLRLPARVAPLWFPWSPGFGAVPLVKGHPGLGSAGRGTGVPAAATRRERCSAGRGQPFLGEPFHGERRSSNRGARPVPPGSGSAERSESDGGAAAGLERACW